MGKDIKYPEEMKGEGIRRMLSLANSRRKDPMFSNAVGYLPMAYHLVPKEGLAKVAAVMRCGERAGRPADEWRKVPVEELVNHAISHLQSYLAGDRSDHHLANAGCRVLMALDLDQEELLPKPEFDLGSPDPFGPNAPPFP